MAVTSQEDSTAAKPAAPKAKWLPLLERELKRRIGWVDEAISPFARRHRADKDAAQLRRAA